MFKRLPAPLLGILSFSLVCLNTIFHFVVMLPFIALKILIPLNKIRRHYSLLLIHLASNWVQMNSTILKWTQRTEWDIEGLEALDLSSSYLVISNHTSWTDIFVLQHVFKDSIPFLKFFIKKELIWVPLLGIVWWAMDMPFMKRYSQEFLSKHPELKGRDMEATRRSCEKFKQYPVSVINFLEGTRFTEKKRMTKNSPYHHLLSPKAGGIALTLSVMGDVLKEVLDVTILYTTDNPGKILWQLFSGQLKKITVRVTKYSIPQEVYGKNYLEDEAFKREIHTWINHIWAQKDQQMKVLKEERAC